MNKYCIFNYHEFIKTITIISYVPYVNMHHNPQLFIQIEITSENNIRAYRQK